MKPGVKVKEALNTGLAGTGTVSANSGDRSFPSSSGSGSGSGKGGTNATTGQVRSHKLESSER
jgi:hypothetical protein